MTFKTSLISVAVLLTLSSCGKNKDLKTSGDAPKPAATQPNSNSDSDTGSAAQNQQTQQNQNHTKNGSDQAAPKVDGSVKNQRAKDEGRKDRGGHVTIGDGENSDDQKKSNEDKKQPVKPSTIKEQSPKKQDDAKSDSKQDDSKKVETKKEESKKEKEDTTQVKRVIDVDKNQIASKTGGQTKDLLYYTGAGDDGLMEEFKSYLPKASPAQQHVNAKLAKSIVGARLTKAVGGDQIIDLAIEESVGGGRTGIKNYRLKAQQAGNMMKLSQVSATGSLQLQNGYLKCLDTDGSCMNAYAKVKMSGGIARVIFRKTVANVYFLIQENIVNNDNFNLMNWYIKNRTQAISTTQKINLIETSSYEVVNGASAIGLTMKTSDNEMISLTTPLLVSPSGSVVDVGVSKGLDLSKSFNLSSNENYESRLQNAISDARLVANNGRGQLKIKLNFAAAENTGAIWVVVSKSATSSKTLSVENVRAFEASLK